MSIGAGILREANADLTLWLILALALTAGCWLFFFGFFEYALQIPFPKGALFDWLPAVVADFRQVILG